MAGLPSSGAYDGAKVLVMMDQARIVPGVKATRDIGSGNAGVRYTAKNAGTGAHSTQVAHVNGSGNNVPTSVAVAGNTITVTLGTGGTGTVNATAAQVVTVVNAHVGASALVVASPIGDGTGTAVAAAAAALAGGVNAILDPPPDLQVVAAQTGMSYEKSREMLDASVKGTDHSESSYGRMEGSLTLDALSSYKNGTQARMEEAIDEREIVMLRYVVDGSAISDDPDEPDIVKEAPALVSSISFEAPDNENATFNCEFNLNDRFRDVA